MFRQPEIIVGTWKAAHAQDSGITYRVLRMMLLTPDLVAAILDGRKGPEVTLAQLMQPFPADWSAQVQAFART